MRVGYFRIGVYRDEMDRLISKFENVEAKGTGMDPALFDVGRFDYCRFNVYVPLFDQLQKTMENAV